ncbi:MAG TPA: hypothetical protein VFQ22_02850 [Longimicrobiales bacterium]|nr:hypothetical protein [Longimicrobiales bacterium]
MTHPIRTRRPRARAAAGLALLALALAACDDDPFRFDWDDTPRTAQLYSLALPTPGLPSGYSFVEHFAVLVESPGATGRWDVALGTEGSSLVLLPPGALGVGGNGGIATITDRTFDEVTEAPGGEVYETRAPVPVASGQVYVVRTTPRPTRIGTCTYFAKLEPTEIDVAAGQLTFRYLTAGGLTPICNSREFVPPDD